MSSHHVVVGAGPVGSGVALALAARGDAVSVVTRSGSGPTHPLITLVAADVASAGGEAQITSLAKGARSLINAVNPPYHRWDTDWPPLHNSMMRAAEATGAHLVIMSNLYAYGPQSGAMTETLPLKPAGKKARVRAEMWEGALAAQRSGKLTVTEVRAGDFFGATVKEAALGERFVVRMLKGKSGFLFGNLDTLHSFSYMPDVVAALVIAATNPAAVGRPLIAPVITCTQRELANALSRAAGRPSMKLSIAPWAVIRALGVFIPVIRELRETRYQWDEEFVASAEVMASEFGLLATELGRAASETVSGFGVEPSAQIRLVA
jgi:nucleoside-diphosphate-sugar epimerase